MGLVDYDSDSSEDDDTNQKEQAPPVTSTLGIPSPKRSGGAGAPRKFVIEKPEPRPETTNDKPATTAPKTSLLSMLPKPKNISKETATRSLEPEHPKSIIAAPRSQKSRTLGGGISGQFDGEVQVEEYYAPGTHSQQETQSVKITPASVLAKRVKYGKSMPRSEPEPVKKSVKASENDAAQDTDTKKAIPHPKQLGQSLFSFHKEEELAEAQQPTMDILSSGPPAVKGDTASAPGPQLPEHVDVGAFETNKGKRKHIDVVDFDVNDFYERNNELREAGTLQDEEQRRKVHNVGSGRHQLSSIIASAQQNEEGLEEMFQEAKRKKTESRKRLGFS